MKKISKALRREAVEFAGCMAWWWAQLEAGDFPDATVFGEDAVWLANEACCTVRPYWVTGESSYLAPVWAEAQAMLLDGWTP